MAAQMLWLCLRMLPCMPAAALAANGYTQYGYGNASKSMAGVSYALPQDSLIPASNPAGLSLLDDRFDLGVDWLAPRRDASISGNRQVTLASADGHWDANQIGHFFVPELGYSHRYSEQLSYGIAVYGNGGLNTNYSENPFGGFGASGHAGVDMSQVFVSPTLALRLGERQSIGLALNLAYQQLSVYGLNIFATRSFPGPYSESPDHVTDQGYDRAYGLGYRLGWLAEPLSGLMIGLSWQPQTHMSRFDKYRGLLPGQGRLDSPPNYGGGLSYRWQNKLVLAADIQRIRYDAVQAIGTPLQPFLDGALLGSDHGPGFGWRAMTIYKLGLGYRITPALRLALGYSDGRQPIPDSQTLFNILTPAILGKHYTTGFVYDFGTITLSGYYFYAPSVNLLGKHSIPPNQPLHPLPPQSFGGGEADLHAQGQTAGLAIGYRF